MSAGEAHAVAPNAPTPARPAAIPALDLAFARGAVAGRVTVVVGCVTYAALLVASYVSTIAPAFSYLGYTLNPAPAPYLALGFLLGVLPSMWLPLRMTRPSVGVVWILYLLAYVPSVLMPLLSLVRPASDVVFLVMAVGAAFALLTLVPRLPRLYLRRLPVRPLAFWTVLVLLCGFLLLQVTNEHGVALDLPSLAAVYDVREEYKEAEGGRLSRIGVSWIGNVLAPFLIAVALVRRQPLRALPGLLLLLYLFSITGFRSLLFAGLVLVVLYLASLWRGRMFGAILAWGGAAVVSGSWLLDQTLQTIVFTGTFVRRLIATPGMLTGWYYDFFSDNPQVRLSHSVLGRWIEYPYEVAPPFLIGDRYFGRAETYANANFWADAFANFGFTGLFVATVVVALVLWAFDASVGSGDATRTRLAVLLLGVPAFTLSNTALTTTLLTHGLALALLLVYVVPSEMTAPWRGARPRRVRAEGWADAELEGARS